MQAPDPVEAIMARLMPPALSQDRQLELDGMIDDLAGPEAANVVALSQGKWLARCVIGGGIAAAVGALLAIFPMILGDPGAHTARNAPAAPAPGVVLISESDRIESVTDEGWREDSEGSAMHAVRLKAVQENNVRDEETGMLVRISEPREEILMMPISEFYEPPALQRPVARGLVEAAALPAPTNGPLRVVNVAGKSAGFYSPEDGRAEVRREGAVYQVKISGPKDEVLYEGELARDAGLDAVPEGWRRKIQVICRTLDQELDGNITPRRQPQPRQVPPVPQKP